MSAPAPIRCAHCGYMPASAVTVCPVCKQETAEPFQGLLEPCIYFRKECSCGLRGFCLEAA